MDNEKNILTCPYCGGRGTKTAPHNGFEEWKCNHCGYSVVIANENDQIQLFEVGRFSDNVIKLIHRKRSNKKEDIKSEWMKWVEQLEYKLDDCIGKYGGDLAQDPLFGMAHVAHMTYGFQMYPNEDIKDKAETLYELALKYVKEHKNAAKLQELISLYDRKLHKRVAKRRNKILMISGIAVAVCIAGFLSFAALYSPMLNDKSTGVSVNIPSGAVAMFDKLSVKMDVEMQPSNSATYIDAKNALHSEVEKFTLYDISLSNGSKKTALDGNVTVTLPIPDGYDTGALKIYYIKSESEFEEISSSVSVAEGTISFQTSHFSLYAVAERHPIVNFDSAGGNDIDRQIVKRDTLAASPEIPKRTGYVFDGWMLNGVKWNFNSDTVKTDITLMASWKKAICNVTLELDGGQSEVTSLTVEYMSEYSRLPTPQKEGYNFIGWYTSTEHGSLVENITAMEQTSDHTLYARYEKKQNIVIFDANGGEGSMEDFAVLYGESVKLPKNTLTRTGYVFTGWSTGKTGDVEYADQAEYIMGADDSYKLYAQWQISTGVLKFNANGGEGSMEEIPMSYANAQRLPSNLFTRTGYTFMGWSTSASGDIEYADGTEYTIGEKSEYILYAVWKKDTNIVRFNANVGEGTMTFVSGEFDTFIYLPKCQFARTGYEFVGWSDKPDGNAIYIDGAEYKIGSEKETILYAIWTGSSNSFEFYGCGADGHMPSDFTVKTGEAVALPNNAFTRKGYEFEGWATDEYGTVKYIDGAEYKVESAGAVKLYAKWSLVEYTASFESNGGSDIADRKYNIESEDITLQIPNKTGYDFSGWYTADDFSGDGAAAIMKGSYGNKTFYAKWTPIKYSVTFDSQGGSAIDPMEFTIASDNFTLPSPTKNGYWFEGWFYSNGNKAEQINKGTHGNIKLTAKWSIVEYTVSFFVTEGNPVNSIEYNIETDTFILPTATRMGYDFSGWYTNSALSGEPVSKIEKGSYANIKLYPKWEVKTYTIEFDTKGGDIIEDKPYTIESEDFSLPIPTKTGYNFGGWYSNMALEGETTSEITKGTTSNKYFYAKWLPITYYVSFITNGGSAVDDIPFTIENKVIITAQTQKDNYVFVGWYKDPEFNGSRVNEIPAGTYENITLYANWSKEAYTITYIEMGGDDIYPDHYTVEDPTFTLKQATRAGYTFEGWYTSSSYSGDRILAIEKGSSGDKTLYAKWSDPIQYTAILDANGGTAEESSISFTVVSDQLPLPTPQKTGYIFAGWYPDEKFEDAEVKSIASGSVGNRTYYAKWTPEQFTIKYNVNGGDSIVNGTYTIESIVNLPEASRTGYTFAGWYTDEALTGTRVTGIEKGTIGNKTFYAKWSEPIEYKVTLNTNGGTVSQSSIIYTVESDTITLPTPTKTGYTFGGWYTDEALTGSKITSVEKGTIGNKEFYAKWEIVEYTISLDANYGTFEIDGETVSGNNVGYIHYNIESEGITFPIPTRSGYKFVGWKLTQTDIYSTSIPTGTVGDKYYMATWEVIHYIIDYELNGGAFASGWIRKDYVVYTDTFDLAAPTKAGCTFEGWYTNSSFTGTKVTTIAKGSTGDKKFWAKWSANTYTITYNLNTSSVKVTPTLSPKSKDVKYDDPFTLDVPICQYYTFDGWWTAASGGTQITNEQGKSVSDYSYTSGKTLYAHWKQQYADYTYISTATEFKNIKNNMSGKYMLVKDINLGSDWTPLGTYAWEHAKDNDNAKIGNPFKGTIDGQNHTITYSTKINGLTNNDMDYAWGLFGTSNGATFKNINLSAVIESDDNHETNNGRECAVGGLVGLAYNTTFTNCSTVAGSSVINFATDCTWYAWGYMQKEGFTYAGGIVGDARGCTLTNCSNQATVEAHGYSVHAGGIAGNAYNTTISNCSNNGTINFSWFDWTYGAGSAGEIYGKNNAPWCRANGSEATAET